MDTAAVMLEIFSAIERRDRRRIFEFCHPDVEFHWPPSLPYGATARPQRGEGPTWADTWDPLQPTETERKMDPRVVAVREEEVVVLWRQRGVSPGGDRIDVPVLGLYHVRGGKLARAQMFYFDTATLVSFLARTEAKGTTPTATAPASEC